MAPEDVAFFGAGPAPIEDYALIGDCTTAALVSRAGSIDWLCWPRFDSPACFATCSERPTTALGASRRPIRRRMPGGSYIDGSVVLETVFATESGEVALIDFMPVGHPGSSIVRIVEGRRGTVDMRMAMALRFDYGAAVPWVTRLPDDGGILAIAGPDMAALRTPVEAGRRGPDHGGALHRS